MSYRCPICKASFKHERAHNAFIFKDRVLAGLHDFRIAQDISIFPDARRVVPARFLLLGASWREGYYVKSHALRLYNILCGVFVAYRHGLDGEYGLDVQYGRLQENVRIWLHRILLDSENYAIYQMIFDSLAQPNIPFSAASFDSLELLNRLSDLFDLPKFWVKR